MFYEEKNERLLQMIDDYKSHNDYLVLKTNLINFCD